MDKLMKNLCKCSCVIDSLRLHYLIVALLYVASTIIAYKVINTSLVTSDPITTEKSFLALIGSGSILATFGSALSAIGLIWQGDLLERFKLNVDIFYKDIVKQEHWRRWPFLDRDNIIRVKNGDILKFTLKNPPVLLDAGYETVVTDLPVIPNDFFDLPVIENFRKLYNHRSAAHFNYSITGSLKKNPKTQRKPSDEFMAYECLYDIWLSGIKFRASRYVVHFGTSLTIAGAIIVFIFYTTKML